MIENYKNVVFNNYANFEGRARRREYWLFYLANAIIYLILFLSYCLCRCLGSSIYMDIFCLVLLLFNLVLFIPNLALSVRRLHDTNRSGWWVLISLIPTIGTIIFFVFSVLPGTEGENEYGPDPKANELK